MSKALTKILKIEIANSILGQNELPELKDLEKYEVLEIWMDPDVHLNSAGISKWMRWLKPASQSKALIIHLYKCPSHFVQLANIVKEVIPKHALVMSFYAPYYSKDTDESRLILLERGKHFSESELILPKVSDSKLNPMELDADPDRFFRFLPETKVTAGK